MSCEPVLILGATSPIARGAAHAFAQRGHALFLASRDQTELQRISRDITIRYGVEVYYDKFDVDQTDQHLTFLLKVKKKLNGFGGVLFAIGDMGDHQRALQDFAAAEQIIKHNFTGAVSILNHCANYFEEKNGGFIVGISSVAGDRGRQSNYFYGSAKGALSLYLQGLRNRLHPFGVRVITIKPGFVDTSLTFGKPGVFFVASPLVVGRKISKTINGWRDIVYLPWFWRYIMLIIKLIPEFIFKRLKL